MGEQADEKQLHEKAEDTPKSTSSVVDSDTDEVSDSDEEHEAQSLYSQLSQKKDAVELLLRLGFGAQRIYNSTFH